MREWDDWENLVKIPEEILVWKGRARDGIQAMYRYP
jgi:hypothetical protein